MCPNAVALKCAGITAGMASARLSGQDKPREATLLEDYANYMARVAKACPLAPYCLLASGETCHLPLSQRRPT